MKPNERLRSALQGRGLTPQDLAPAVGVDAKTIERWITTGRIPYPRHRHAVATRLGLDVEELWPTGAVPAGATDVGAGEVMRVYPQRSAVPGELWRTVMDSARQEIGVLVYSGLFLSEDWAVQQIMRAKAEQGVRVRILLGDPAGGQIGRRGEDEGVGGAMAAKINNALVMYAPLRSLPGIEFRFHDTILYNSIYRADDELLVNTHLYGLTAAHAPVLHLRRTGDGSMVNTYLDSFERVWASAVPLTPPE